LKGVGMKVAVTGGAGYIGSTLVNRLLAEGMDVTCIDNLTKGDYKHLKSVETHKKPDLLIGDIRDRSLLDEAFEGADAIAHLAAIPGLTQCKNHPEEAISVNIYGTHQVLEAAKSNDIRKVVFCSSAAVYGTPLNLPVDEFHPLLPLNLYGVTKLSGEKLMSVYHVDGLDTVSLRFGNVFGVGLYSNWDTVIPKFVRQALEGKPMTIYGDGENSRDFVHVEDISEAIMLSLKSEGIAGEAYNVGGEVLTIGRLSEIILKEIERVTGRVTGISYLPSRPGETKNFSYNLEKIREKLGYVPKWTVEKGIEQLIEYWVSQFCE
jgi:UDP-glucose 4-epimerase